MRARILLAAVVALLTALPTGCGDNRPGTASPSTAEPATTAATTTGPDTEPHLTTTVSPTAPPFEQTVVWRETLDLGSTVAVRHLVVSSGLFLAMAEADFRRPGDVTMSAFVSPDGEDWAEVELPPEQFANIVLFELEGGPVGFIATGARIDENGAATGPSVWTSPDGEEWTSTELATTTVPAPASQFIFDDIDSLAVAVTPTGFVAVAEIRRHFDVEAILDAHAPNFEWPEFASMETRTLADGDVQLTIGGEGGNDFVATFSELGIDPVEMPIGDTGSDFISLSMGSSMWTSADGSEWVESRGPEFSSASLLLWHLAVDSTAAGLFVHGYDYAEEKIAAWHSVDGSDWIEVDLPGRPVADWNGGVYSFDQREHLWTSTDGTSWTVSAGPEAMANARDIWPSASTPDGPIAVVGMRSDDVWKDDTVPEAWVAVSTNGTTWWEAGDVEAFGMPIWPEAIASDGDRIVLGLVGEPPAAAPYSALWSGTVTGP